MEYDINLTNVMTTKLDCLQVGTHYYYYMTLFRVKGEETMTKSTVQHGEVSVTGHHEELLAHLVNASSTKSYQ